MKTHDHMKPFQCAICNRGYNTAAALTSHMQNHKRDKNGTNNGTGTTSGSGSALALGQLNNSSLLSTSTNNSVKGAREPLVGIQRQNLVADSKVTAALQLAKGSVDDEARDTTHRNNNAVKVSAHALRTVLFMSRLPGLWA